MSERPTAYELGIEIEGYTPTASERRYRGIREINNRFLYIDEVNGTSVYNNVTIEEITSAIRALASRGRTERWTKAIEGWAKMVDDNPDNLVWAILQGSVGAGYAAK